MTIKTIRDFDTDVLKVLYEDAGWASYLKNDTAFKDMFTKSLDVLGAYENDELIGLVRVVGDDNHIVYIQDILVLKNHQRQGVGNALINTILNRYSHVRQIVLMTDATDAAACKFYQNNGFKTMQEANIVGYVKLKS